MNGAGTGVKGAGNGGLRLLEAFPGLGARLAHVPLGSWPTPVDRLERVERRVGLGRLYVKRDDLSGALYGGNKVRKLEFLLAEAVRSGARTVITVGFAGSNHALATAIYARSLGLGCVSMLMPQVNAHYVRRNLKAGLHYGAELVPCANIASLSCAIAGRMLGEWWRTRTFPTFVPGGGSCPLGAIGYVNAAFELAAQVRAGLLREPDVIYVPMGSMGTCAGLALGLEAVGLRSRVFAVRVIERRWAGVAGLRKLLDGTAALLRKCEPGFPDLAGARDRLVVRDEFLGDGYAHFTRKGVAAAELLYGEAGIVMNGSYSAKAFAAMLDDAAQSRMGDKTVLFWNTYNSRDVAGFAAGVDHRHLTGAFVRYFEDDVQPLDRDGIDR